ncbi:hypothetical protein SCHPADRAFT_679584 [Schizopora paradoxa]|uniref:Uncharacterized protein n=1 Tax=Schizopora paradoxa TaxID=27342 RepID=A0A0H2R4H6_9AGAM|nr:hypothetical protein SCHPADRAFT_679584 [Schizopora paradoxa]
MAIMSKIKSFEPLIDFWQTCWLRRDSDGRANSSSTAELAARRATAELLQTMSTKESASERFCVRGGSNFAKSVEDFGRARKKGDRAYQADSKVTRHQAFFSFSSVYRCLW